MIPISSKLRNAYDRYMAWDRALQQWYRKHVLYIDAVLNAAALVIIIQYVTLNMDRLRQYAPAGEIPSDLGRYVGGAAFIISYLSCLTVRI